MARARQQPINDIIVVNEKKPVKVELVDDVAEVVRTMKDVTGWKQRGSTSSKVANGLRLDVMIMVSFMSQNDRDKLMIKAKNETAKSLSDWLNRFAKQGAEGTIKLDNIAWPKWDDKGELRDANTVSERLSLLPFMKGDDNDYLKSYRKFFDYVLPTKVDKTFKTMAKEWAKYEKLNGADKDTVKRLKEEIEAKKGVKVVSEIDIAQNKDNYRIIGKVDDIDKIDDK
jgi:hypothetical protein